MKRLMLSLLERLQEDSQREGRTRTRSRVEARTELVESVRQHLNSLLNTKRLHDAVPEGFDHCAESLLTFGMPDFSVLSLENPEDEDSLRLAMQQAIARFEPRLSAVDVTTEPRDHLIPILRFRVSALLRTQPVPEQVCFDTVLHPDKGLVVVQEAR